MPGTKRVRRRCPSCDTNKQASMFRRGQDVCVACANAGHRVPPLPPPKGIEIPISDTRVLSVRAIAGLAVLQTAEVMTSEVHAVDPLRGITEVTRRSRALRILSHLSIPVSAAGEVATALRRVSRIPAPPFSP
jgi:hypothetical protein